MNNVEILCLKGIHKIYTQIFKKGQKYTSKSEGNVEKATEIIHKMLISDAPCMIARFGAFELSTIVNYLGVENKEHSVIKYIKGEQPQWWWNKKLMMYMQNNAGFFPSTKENLSLFSQMMINDAKEVDVLGSWLENEKFLDKELKKAYFIHLRLLEPFWSVKPWTSALKRKKILVIHPFSDSIEKQYCIRRKLFSNPNILPDFELKTIKAVQSIGGCCDRFKDWFEALNWMKDEMDKIDYDICLIGCGAYGFPLAAHAKRMGKKAVHLGGCLQLLFGIKGKRWDKNMNKFYNEYWIRPSPSEKPTTAENVENSCYW